MPIAMEREGAEDTRRIDRLRAGVPPHRRGDRVRREQTRSASLCAARSRPTLASTSIELFAQPDAVQHPWESHQAAFEQDLGGARFTGKSFEYAQANELKAVCVNFMQWSSEHPHIARILVQYGFGDAPQPRT